MNILKHELEEIFPERPSYKDYYCNGCNIYVWIPRVPIQAYSEGRIYYSKLSREQFLQSNPMTRIGEVLDVTCNEMMIKNIIE